MRKFLCFLISMAALGFAPSSAWARCAAAESAISEAVRSAMDSGNVNPVLAYAPSSAEQELRERFVEANKVRDLGDDARILVDRFFLETAMRLHQAGEGASFEGIKPADCDHDPVAIAAERTINSGNLAHVMNAIMREVEYSLRQRLDHIRELQRATKEPETAGQVSAARKRISAELAFASVAEDIYRAALEKKDRDAN